MIINVYHIRTWKESVVSRNSPGKAENTSRKAVNYVKKYLLHGFI